MAFSVRVLQRDFSAPLNLDGLALRVVSYAFDEEGGPKQADLEVLGGREDLWELMELLRCPIEIMDEEEEVVWWGYLSRAEVHDGVMVDAAELDEMFNRLALAYTTSIPGISTPGDRATTAWVQDDDSVNAYGTKEILLSKPQATAGEAENERDYELTQRKYPLPVTTVGTAVVDPPYGRLVCRGWWDTLAWVYFGRAAGLEQNAETQGDVNLGGPTETVIGTSHLTLNGTQAFGNAGATTKLETSFSLAGNMTLTDLAIRIQTNGAPADDVLLKVFSDAAGVPNTLLATATISTGTITGTLAWVTETLDTPYAALAATTYHLEISRSGANDAVNYYTVSVDEGLGYPSGQFKIWNGAAWVARAPNADLAFRVGGEGVYTKSEQAFQLTGGEAWQASNVQIYAHAEGSPADDLRVRLYTDSSGAPGSLLATGTFVGTDVPTSPAWLTFELDTEVALSLATTYHLQVDRTGATDATNYYVVGVDEGLHYASYVMKVWNGAAWVRRAEDADLAFIIGGVEETTTQIETALASAEFITDVDIQQASGVTTSPYRNGDQRLLDVVRELLQAGISGGARLLATVTKDRIVRLYQAPEKTAYAYLINRRGEISTPTQGPVDLQKCPVAVWMRRTDIPGEANTERLVDLTKFYVEAAEFSPTNGYTPTPRGAQRPFELPGQVSM